jgi:hypothetical protein
MINSISHVYKIIPRVEEAAKNHTSPNEHYGPDPEGQIMVGKFFHVHV